MDHQGRKELEGENEDRWTIGEGMEEMGGCK